jgi:hypothetical protein
LLLLPKAASSLTSAQILSQPLKLDDGTIGAFVIIKHTKMGQTVCNSVFNYFCSRLHPQVVDDDTIGAFVIIKHTESPTCRLISLHETVITTLKERKTPRPKKYNAQNAA